METALIAHWQNAAEARRSLFYPAWALAATALVCSYNFFAVGLPELHSMPSIVGQFVNVERLSRWVDPQLAYIDYHLAFMQDGSTVKPYPTQSLMQVLPGMFNPATMAFVGGSIVIAISWLVLSRWSTGSTSSFGYGPASAAAYLMAVLAMLAGLRMFGGGPGSSLLRFTDFTNPLGIALGVVLLTATVTLATSRLSREILAIAVASVACAAMYVGFPSLLAQHWRSSIGFLIGKNTYAAMNDGNWETVTAHRLAAFLPGKEKAELLNFLPGFTAVPDSPFQRPDGCAYIKDYTKVLYGSEEQAAEIYARSKINYFLFDVSNRSALVWSAFSRLFTPESIRSRMRLVPHDVSERQDLYLLTWNRDKAPAGGEPFEIFLQRWSDKLTSEKINGYAFPGYEQGAQRIGRR